MLKYITAFLLALCATAQAQVLQSGSVTPGHPSLWISDGVIGDGGTAANGSLTGVGVTASGPSICANSGPVTGAYNRFCIGASSAGGILTLDNVGGATGGFTIQLNGVLQGFATTALPTITNDLVCYSNITGGLQDCGISSIIPTSVSNSDGTLTISPTTGAVVASLALGHANTWTAVQTFTNSDLALLGSSTGSTTFASANVGASNFTITFPAATGTVALVANANVISVSNSDGTLTISPTTGLVVASINLANSNTWTAAQNFTLNQNATTQETMLNNSAGVSALAQWTWSNGTNTMTAGMGGTAYSVGLYQGRGYVTANGAALVVGTSTLNPYVMIVNNLEVGRWDSVTPGTLIVGLATASTGQIKIVGITSGGVTQTVQSVAGTPTVTWGTGTGTPAVTASNPLAIVTATGNITCTTCATTTNGGTLTATSPVSISAAGVIALTGTTGSGTVVVLQTSPVLVTPTLGVAAATSLAIGGCTIGTDALCVTGTTTHTGGVTVAAGPFTLSGNQSVTAWTTNGVRIKGVIGTMTDTTSSGTVATAYTDVLGGNTIAATSVTTYTNYVSLYVKAPVQGTNVTFTNAWALGADSLRIGTSNQFTISTVGAVGINAALTYGGVTLSNSVTGTGSMVLSTNPTFTTSIISPIVYGGTAAGSTLTLQTTTSGSPSGDSLSLKQGGAALVTLIGGKVGMGTETNPTAPFVFSTNTTTGQGTGVGVGEQFQFIGADGSGGTNLAIIEYGTGASTVFFYSSGGTAASSSAIVNAQIIGNFGWIGYDGVTAINAASASARILATAAQTFTGSNHGTYVEIDATVNGGSRAQAMRLQAGVIIGTGTTDPGAGSLILGTADASSTSTGAIQNPGGMSVNKRVWFNGITTSSGLQTAVLCQSSGGEIIADSVACLASSAIFKEHFSVFSNATALDHISVFQPKSWNYRREPGSVFPERYYRERIGLVAEDVAAIDTRLVEYDNKGEPRTIDYNGVVTLLVGAVKQLKADNDNLRAEMARLASKIR